MAKEYIVGGKYFLPVTVFTTDARSPVNPVGIEYVSTTSGRKCGTFLCDDPDILLTAEEVYASQQMAGEINHIEDMLDYGREKYAEIATLKSENERLSKQNEELRARVEELTGLTNYYIAERKRDNLNIRLLLDKIAELEGKNG